MKLKYFFNLLLSITLIIYLLSETYVALDGIISSEGIHYINNFIVILSALGIYKLTQFHVKKFKEDFLRIPELPWEFYGRIRLNDSLNFFISGCAISIVGWFSFFLLINNNFNSNSISSISLMGFIIFVIIVGFIFTFGYIKMFKENFESSRKDLV